MCTQGWDTTAWIHQSRKPGNGTVSEAKRKITSGREWFNTPNAAEILRCERNPNNLATRRPLLTLGEELQRRIGGKGE